MPTERFAVRVARDHFVFSCGHFISFDGHLRSEGNKLNPGTTADLITACLFVALRERKVAPTAPFRWQVPDWL